MTSRRPQLTIKISSGLLSRVAAICEAQNVTRNQLVNLMIEHGCRAFESAERPASVQPPESGYLPPVPLPSIPVPGTDLKITRSVEQPAPEPGPSVVTDAAGNSYTLQPLNAADQARLAQRRVQVTGQDAGTQLDGAIEVAIGQAMEDWTRSERAHEAGIVTARTVAEALQPGPEREALEVEGSLHTHQYVIVPGTTRTLNTEPYTGQSYAMFACACGTSVAKPLE